MAGAFAGGFTTFPLAFGGAGAGADADAWAAFGGLIHGAGFDPWAAAGVDGNATIGYLFAVQASATARARPRGNFVEHPHQLQ